MTPRMPYSSFQIHVVSILIFFAASVSSSWGLDFAPVGLLSGNASLLQAQCGNWANLPRSCHLNLLLVRYTHVSLAWRPTQRVILLKLLVSSNSTVIGFLSSYPI